MPCGAVARAAACLLFFPVRDLPAADLEWVRREGGSYEALGNWSPLVQPGAVDRLVFNLGAVPGYSVTLLDPEVAGSLHLGNDNVTFDLGGGSLDLGAAAGVVVAPVAPFASSLDLVHGTVLSKAGAILPAPGAAASVRISGPAGAWEVSGDLQVGRSPISPDASIHGAASLVIAGDARLRVSGALRVEGPGDAPGVLRVLGAGFLEVNDTLWIGPDMRGCGESTNQASAEFGDGAQVVVTNWVYVGGVASDAELDIHGSGTRLGAGWISIGRSCGDPIRRAVLRLRDGATIETKSVESYSVIGHEGSPGVAWLTGVGTRWSSPGNLYIGSYSGRGELSIEEGAHMEIDGLFVGPDRSDGGGPGSSGTVRVAGRGSRLTVGSTINLGGTDGESVVGGVGSLTLAEQGIATAMRARIGPGCSIDTRTGSIRLGGSSGSDPPPGEFVIDPDGILVGVGRIRGRFRNDGSVHLLVADSAATIEGEFVQGERTDGQDNDPTLFVTALPDGRFTRIDITGTATLGGRLEVVLPEGFRPSITNGFIPILTCRERFGSFSSVRGNRIPGTDLSLQPIYVKGGVLLEARLNPPVILDPHDPIDVSVGGSVTLTHEVFGAGPFEYQWLLNGVAVPSATNPVLKLSNVTQTEGGSYTLAVSGPAGSTLGPPTILRVRGSELYVMEDIYPYTSADVTGDFESLEGSIRSRNTLAKDAYEPGEPSHADEPGGRSVWTNWRAPSNGVVTFSTVGSSFDTLLAAYEWRRSVAQLGEVKLDSDDDRGGFATSRIRFNARAGVVYVIAVAGYSPGLGEVETGDIVLSWSLDTEAPELPRLMAQPAGRTAVEGSAVSLTVSAEGDGLRYQWFDTTRGTPVAMQGQVAPVLTFERFTAADAGEYGVEVISGEGGTNRSRAARLELGLVNAPLAGRAKRFRATFEPGGGGASRAPHLAPSSGFLPLNAGFKRASFAVAGNQSQLQRCAPYVTNGFWYGFVGSGPGIASMTCSNATPGNPSRPALGIYRADNKLLQACTAKLMHDAVHVDFEVNNDVAYFAVVSCLGNGCADAQFVLTWQTESEAAFAAAIPPISHGEPDPATFRIRRVLPEGILQLRRAEDWVDRPGPGSTVERSLDWKIIKTITWPGGLAEEVVPSMMSNSGFVFFGLQWNGEFPSTPVLPNPGEATSGPRRGVPEAAPPR